MKHYLLTIFSILCGIQCCIANVTGQIVNDQQEPVLGASVVLLSLPDSIYVAGAATSADGYFEIAKDISSEPYLLRVEAFGYSTEMLNVDAHTKMPMLINLKLGSTQLAEIVVSGKGPMTTQEAGKFIFIPNNLADDVPSARGLMDYVPLVTWSDRDVSIYGRGSTKIYLNGRDPHWETIEVSAMLRTLDPHYIKRVEVITDPGASEQASASIGIINIIYDDPKQGWRGNVLAHSYLNNDNPAVWPNLWLNYEKNKFKTSINLEYAYSHNYSHSSTEYNYLDLQRSVINNTKATSFANSLKGKLNMSYDLTERSVIGAAVSIGTQRSHNKTVVSTITESENMPEEKSEMVQTTDIHPDKPFLNALAYYTLNIDNRGSMIDVLAGYTQSASHTDIKNIFSGVNAPQLLENDGYSFSAKADYIQVLNPRTRLMAGLYFQDTHTKDVQTLENVYDNFKYTDRQIQGYVQVFRRWSDYVSMNVGLRLENTHTLGTQLADNMRNKRDYTDLFPSFSIAWNIPKWNQGVSFSYERSITRPGYGMLNPYRIWSSDNSYSVGNPYLKPEYADRVALRYSFLNKFMIGTSYIYQTQLTNAYTVNTTEGISVSSFTNSGRANFFNFYANFESTIGAFWRISADVSTSYRNIKTHAGGQNVHTNAWSLSLSQSNTFIVSRKHYLLATLLHKLSTPTNYGLYKEDLRYSFIAAIQKSFSFGLDASVECSVPVTGFKKARSFELSDYSYRIIDYNHQYSIHLTLSYTFGKSQVRGAQDRLNELHSIQ
ncbi:MAG: TonB-dependent receptor [Muribaculaceae bacterium]|nr:TonB-dependent receptor [Muribaculaceae bacterium]